MATGFITTLILLSLGNSSAAREIAVAHQEQQRAVFEIERLGGKVFYDYQRPDPQSPNTFDPEASPKEADKLYWIVRVSLRDTKVVDQDLKLLTKFPHLENVDLSNTQITSAGLQYLTGAKRLAVLSLWNTQVDDSGLKHIKNSKELWSLVLDGTKVTDDGLAHLSGLTKLEEWLGLTNTGVTDAGLRHLTKLTKLRNLNLRQTGVTTDGARDLKVLLPKTDISQGP